MCLDIKPQHNKPNAIEEPVENMMDSDSESDSLRIKRLTGGSVIDYAPLISPDGEVIHVIWNNFVQTYSTSTGEWLRDLEGTNESLVGLAYDHANPKILVGCTVSGKLLMWKWKSEISIKNQNELQFSDSVVKVISFHIVKNNCIVLYATGSKHKIEIFDFESRSSIEQLTFESKQDALNMSVGGYQHNLIAVIKKISVVVCYMNKKNRQIKEYNNLSNIVFTCVTCHPSQDIVLTGDVSGRIILWRNFNKDICKSVFHWHSTPVNCITLSQSGSYFYSGGHENVLVKWTLDNPDKREYLPRMSSIINHITIGSDNVKMAVSTNDNAIQILNPHMRQVAIVQNFTRVVTDSTNIKPFPCGLKLNPRRNTIVLNGRLGHLQFYSPHTKSLLYNLDITLQNIMSKEYEKPIYNTTVTNVTLNADWMATAECWNDLNNSTEIRLKFWHFDEQKQTFSLSTNIELPHDKGICALEFSSIYSTKNLVCASAGLDRVIKMWSLDDTNTIYNKGKHWMCFGKITYKNLPIFSLAFSQDGSLLSAGFGNVLTVWKTDSLSLKCTLSAPACVDGSINKISIFLPKKTKSTPDDKKKYIEKRKLIFEKMQSILEKHDKKLIQEISKDKNRLYENEMQSRLPPLTIKEKDVIFTRIMSLNEMNLIQKIEIFKNLGVYCKVLAQNSKICHFMESSIKGKLNIKNVESNLAKRVTNLNNQNRYLAKRKLLNYQNRKIKSKVNVKIYKKLLNFASDGIPPKYLNGEKSVNGQIKETNENISSPVLEHNKDRPIKKLVQIKHIFFGNGEFSHLVIVCTENRLLVWNLLTVRLQTALKLSAEHIVIDPITNLIAIFTTRNDLYIFLPNMPIPLYYRKNLPKIHGCIWVPRTYPKQCSINVDWQAISQLYFLNENQELLYLISDDDEEAALPNSYIGDNRKGLTFTTPFAAMLSKKNASKKNNSWANINRIGVLGRANIKELIGFPSHTMAPTSLLCKGFIKSLMIENPQIYKNVSTDATEDVALVNGNSSEKVVDEEDEELSRIVLVRKTKLSAYEKSKMEQQKSNVEQQQLEVKLRELTLEKFNYFNGV